MESRPGGSICMRHPYLTQIIINMTSGMDKSSDNPTPAVKPPLENKLGISSNEK